MIRMRPVIGLFCVFLAALAWVPAASAHSDKPAVLPGKLEKQPASAPHAFDPSRLRDISSLRIIHRQDTVILEKSGSGWVTGKDRFPVDSATMDESLGALLRLERVATAVDQQDTGALRKWDLAGPEARQLEWREKSGVKHRIILGRMMDPLTPEQYEAMEIHVGDTASGEHGWVYLPETDTTYWKFADKSDVYRTPGNFARFSALVADWKDRNLLKPFLYQDVRSVEVTWRDSSGKRHHYLLDRVSDTAARLVKPVKAPVPRHNAARIYTQTPQFAVDEFLAKDDPGLAVAGLDKPQISLRITLLNGKTFALKAGSMAGGFHYVQHPRHKSVVKVSKWRFDFFKKTVAELLAPPPPESALQEGMD